MAITREQVMEAAEAILGQGGEPTYLNVRAQLGSGSFSTISKYLREWRENGRESGAGKEAFEMPEAFSETISRLGVEAWREACLIAKTEIEAARSAYEKKVKEVEGELTAAGATVDSLEEKLNALTKERDQLRSENERTKTALASAEGAFRSRLLEAQERLKAQEKERHGLRAENEELKALLSRARGQLDEMEKRINEASERVAKLEEKNEKLSSEVLEEARVRAQAEERMRHLLDEGAKKKEAGLKRV